MLKSWLKPGQEGQVRSPGRGHSRGDAQSCVRSTSRAESTQPNEGGVSDGVETPGPAGQRDMVGHMWCL